MHFQFNFLIVVRTSIVANRISAFVHQQKVSILHETVGPNIHPSIHPSRACFNNRTQLGRAALKLHCCQIDDLWLSLASKCVKSSANLRIVLVKGAGPWVNCGKNETSCICPGHCESSPTHWLKYDGWIYNKFNPWYSMIMKCPHCTGAESQSIAAGKPKGHSSGCVM